LSTTSKLDPALRDAILAEPQALLDDRDAMQALIDMNERRMGANIVDMRGIAMDRLAQRLDKLESTHASVIAAAYENIAGTHQIHRAVLSVLSAQDLGSLVALLGDEVADILRVDAIRLVLEVASQPANLKSCDGVLCVMEPGFIEGYLSSEAAPQRHVALRAVSQEVRAVYGKAQKKMKSEACIRLDVEDENVSGLLLLGARDATMFTPQQGTDLLLFLGQVIEKLLRRWVP